MKYAVVFLLLCSAFYSRLNAQAPIKPSVIAYYTGNEEEIKKFPLASLTHIIYSFFKLDGDTLAFIRPHQRETLRSLVALKKSYPGLKVMVALGGWGGCKPCSPQFAKKEVREKFAGSVVKLLREYGADGLDLDWEYPGIEGFPGHPWMKEDVPNFTELVRALRSAMGNRYELSFAAGGFTSFLEQAAEWDKVMPLVDRVNLMTYDLVSGFSKQTGHHTPLHATSQQKEATDHCVDYLLSIGVPASKLVIGAAFYARVWKDVPDINNGLYQPGEFKTMFGYKKFDSTFTSAEGFKLYWDETARAPYYYSVSRKEFATFDSKESIAAKTRYMLNKKLGGIMFWELSGDKYNGGLLTEITNTINSHK